MQYDGKFEGSKLVIVVTELYNRTGVTYSNWCCRAVSLGVMILKATNNVFPTWFIFIGEILIHYGFMTYYVMTMI